MKKEDHAEILRKLREQGKWLYESGKSIGEIASLFGCSRTKVKVVLYSLEVTMRPFGTKGLHPNLGVPKSEEMRHKLSEAKRGKRLSPEHRDKVIRTLQYGQKGSQNPNWKGGIHLAEGYVYIRMPDHPKALSNHYIKRAILVAEKKLGRMLSADEVTHHINGIKDDDSPENISVISAREHNSITAKERWLRGNFKKR